MKGICFPLAVARNRGSAFTNRRTFPVGATRQLLFRVIGSLLAEGTRCAESAGAGFG